MTCSTYMVPIYACPKHPNMKLAILHKFDARRWDNRVINTFGFMCPLTRCKTPYEVVWIEHGGKNDTR